MKTRTLISRFFLTIGRLLVVCLFLLNATGVAHADNPIMDGDGVIPFAEHGMDFGEVCQNTTITKAVFVAIQRNGNGQVFANNALVTVSPDTTAGIFHASGSGTINLPADWVDKKSDKIISDYTVLAVTFTASSTTGSFTGSVSFNASGAGADKVSIDRKGSLNVIAKVISCDTTPPTINVPANITAEATSASGAAVSFTASADDTNPLQPVVTCDHVSGSTFPLGTTTVTCSATDAAGNMGSNTFTITVQDKTAPAFDAVSDVTAEATGADGALITYTEPGATDLVDGKVSGATCMPISGSTFSIGSTLVTCSATDSRNNLGQISFNIIVRDTTAPVLSLPVSVEKEATSSAGAEVTYTASASDVVDGKFTPTCDPASGSIFPLGSTMVGCSATDAHSNTVTGSFTVNVVDTTPPALTLPDSFSAEATGSNGAVVTFVASAADLVDGAVNVSCSPASGDTFPLGETEVKCSAVDAHKNEAKRSFNITVVDTTPPSLSLPADQLLEATGPNGAVATFSASASDLVDGAITPVCSSISDSTFPLGTTIVSCTATDSHNNKASGSFTIKVQDTIAPAVHCAEPNLNWSGSDITIECSASDSGSGLVDPIDASFTLTTSVADGIETNIAVTDFRIVKDAVGNSTPAGPFENLKIDKKPPQLVSCDQPDGVWHAGNVTLNCTYTDGGSGPATQTVVLSTAIAAGAETNDAQATTTQQAKDAVGNLAPVHDPIPGNWVDRKGPVITIEAPVIKNNTPPSDYLLNQSVTVKFSCTDGGSGVATCDGTQFNGAALDTTTVGPHTFTITSTDNMGNISTQSVTYTVTYATGGQCLGQPGHQVLQPINLEGTSVFKKGSTIPVKFRVCDANGNSVSTAGMVKSFTYSYSGFSTTDMVNEPVYSTTPDTNFRWSATDQQWIYNLSTKSTNFNVTLNASRYIFTITLNDGSIIPFVIGLK